MQANNQEWEHFHVRLEDGGAYYAETNLSQFIVEPWNACSSLVFLIPALYWAFKIRNEVKENGFIAYCIPLLTLGGLGSTFFHAFRSSPWLLWMDVFPILILTLSVSFYFWQRLLNNWWVAAIVVILGFVFRRIVIDSQLFSAHTSANISYAISGMTIFLPVIGILFKTGFYKLNTIVTSILLFVAALFFREIDARDLNLLPMGTHFLWHLFSSAGAFYLAKYLFSLKLAFQNPVLNRVFVDQKTKSITTGDKEKSTATHEVITRYTVFNKSRWPF